MITYHTIAYAVPHPGYLWKWSADFEAIEWHDDTTLAMWQEVHTVLVYFGKRNGLPPFGSVLFLLAACREDWQALRPMIHARIRIIYDLGEHEAIPPELAKVLITGLDAIQGLPLNLRSSLAAKCHLVSAILEGGPHSLTRDKSERILHDFSISGARCLKGHENPKADSKNRLKRDLRALELGLARHDAASLESLIRTGLERVQPEPLELDETITEIADPRLLLDTLIAAGGESGAAAMVAKRAIAMINFPGHVGTPRDLPVGGLADITNRGTIDRLLPGELAWDDLVLAARLVHNEALYFRREIPPMNVAVSHTILLDRDLRLWGLGRIFSLGIALGLWHHPGLNGPGETFECIAATVSDFEHLELDNPSDIQAALERLVPSSDPIAFLGAWLASAQIVDDPSVPDLTFITEKSHPADPMVRNLLGDIAAWIHGKGGHFRVIALGRYGDLEVQAWTPGGNRTLFRGEIDLDQILNNSQRPSPDGEKEATPPPLPLRATAKENPLISVSPIYALEQLPFLFPEIPNRAAYLPDDPHPHSSGGGIGITATRQLVSWPKLGWGALRLASDLPGRIHWMDRDEAGTPVIIASGDKPGDHVRIFRWKDKHLDEIEIAPSLHSFPRFANIDGNHLIIAYTDKLEVISLKTAGRVHVQAIENPPVNPVFSYDLHQVHVYDDGRKPPSPHLHWVDAKQKWPRKFEPDYVSLDDGVLRILSGSQGYEFVPMVLAWQEVKTNSTKGFTRLIQNPLEVESGMNLRLARLGTRVQVWHDPRGILHVKNLMEDEADCWSILLSAPETSVWNSQRGLCSRDQRLRRPEAPRATNIVSMTLAEYLAALPNIVDQS